MCLSTAGRVVEVQETAGVITARVVFERAPEQTCLSYLEDIRVDELVLVAGGAILERVSTEEAEERETFASMLLQALVELQPTPGGVNQ